MAALPGWENRLHEFLSKCVRPKITRVDVAHDFFNGEYTPDQAMLDHDNGHYDVHNMRPKTECQINGFYFCFHPLGFGFKNLFANRICTAEIRTGIKQHIQWDFYIPRPEFGFKPDPRTINIS